MEKRYIFLFLLLLTTLIAFSQEKKDKYGDIALFNKGLAVYDLISETLYLDDIVKKADTLTQDGLKMYNEAIYTKESLLEKSLSYFKELNKEYPKSKLYFMALNNRAMIESELGNEDNFKEILEEILSSKANDKELGGFGDGLMAEPYANYKNSACKQLAEIEYKAGNYSKAIEYLNLTKKFPYQHFCGNAFDADEIFMAENYAKNYLALNDRIRALEYLLPYIIADPLKEGDDDMLILAVNAMKREYGDKGTKLMLDIIIESLHPKIIKTKYDTYNGYFITFENREIKVVQPFETYIFPQEEEQRLLSEHMKKSEFSKLLN